MWKDIKGYEGLYQINEYGEVKSLSRIVINNGGKQVLPERILKPSVVGKGYLKVDLIKKTWKHIHAQLENSNDYPVRE